MQKMLLLFVILVLTAVPVYASDIEPGEIPGNTEFTYPADLPVFFSEPDFSIIIQPASRTVSVNNMANFSVVAVGENLSYAWQYSLNGGTTWYRSSSATQGYNTPTLTVLANASRNGYMYRCIVSNESGTIVTDAVTLSVVTDGSYVQSWNAGDVLALCSMSVAAVGSWFTSLMASTGMFSIYITMIIVVLTTSILMVPILGRSLNFGSDCVSRKSVERTVVTEYENQL